MSPLYRSLKSKGIYLFGLEYKLVAYVQWPYDANMM